MSIRQYGRAVTALVAAYAVALQALLLVVSCPLANAGELAAPICSPDRQGGTAPVPAGHGCDCLAACVAGSCGMPAVQSPQVAVAYAPILARTLTAALEPAPPQHFKTAGAHRSRAPPIV